MQRSNKIQTNIQDSISKFQHYSPEQLQVYTSFKEIQPSINLNNLIDIEPLLKEVQQTLIQNSNFQHQIIQQP